MQKINGHTVRGGWSSQGVYGTLGSVSFSLWPKDTFETSRAKVRQVVKKIEAGKISLPAPVSTSNLYWLLADGTIVAFK